MFKMGCLWCLLLLTACAAGGAGNGNTQVYGTFSGGIEHTGSK